MTAKRPHSGHSPVGMEMSLRALWPLVLAAAAASVCAQETPPPKLPFGSSLPEKPRSITKPAAQLTAGTFEVHFEETTLAQVASRFGSGRVQHRGDASETEYWLCYTAQAETPQRVWIIAHGEMAGPEHLVTQIIAQELAPGARSTRACPQLPTDLQPLTLDNNVWLGRRVSDALRTLGRPSRQRGAWRTFFYAGKVPGDCKPDGFDLTNWLEIRWRLGRITAVAAGQVTSC